MIFSIKCVCILHVACGCSLLGSAAFAGTVKFPKDKPEIVVTIPESWTSTPDKDGDLDFKAPGSDGYSVSLITAPAIHTEAEARAAVLKMAQTIGARAKLDDVQIGEVEVTGNDRNVEFVGVTAVGHSKEKDVDYSIVFQAFQPKGGSWFVYIEADPDKVHDAHVKEYEAILTSTEPAK